MVVLHWCFFFKQSSPLLVKLGLLLHWTNMLENPSAIEEQMSRQHHPGFWKGLLLRGTLRSALRTEQKPTKPFYPQEQ